MKRIHYFIITSISILVSILAIFHVIVGWLKTPQGFIYLWTGHYYLDYFYYLTPIAQGARGVWLSFQQFATDDTSQYPHLWPYIIFGHIGSLFHFSAVTTYWSTIFILFFAVSLLIFFTIRKLLSGEKFTTQFLAFLFAIFATPFFFFSTQGKNLNVDLYDFWYSTSTFFRRFEPIPHHILTSLFVLLSFLSFSRFIDSLSVKKTRNTIFFAAISMALLLLILTFNSYNTITPVVAIFLTSGWYILKNLFSKNKRGVVTIILFCFVLGLLFVLTAEGFKNFYSHTTFMANFKNTESGLHQNPGVRLLLLSIGPLILFFPFGILQFLHHRSPIKILFFMLFLASYLLYFSPIDTMLGTHNGRFLSPLSSVFLGSVGILGMVQISSFFKRFRLIVFSSLVALLILSFVPPTIQSLANSINDRNIFSPITYLSSEIIAGWKYIDRQPTKGSVLMTPSQFLGTLVPTFTGRSTYVARHIATPNYIEKNITASNFYLGTMSPVQALELLRQNHIAYVMLTSIEGYDSAPLYRYPFLNEVYKNKDTLIFQVIDTKLSYESP